MFGAGQAHVQQPRVLGIAGGAGQLVGGDPVDIFLVEFPVQLPVPTVMDDMMAAAVGTTGAQADKRQVHQRVFQALALVQGNDLHAMRIGLQAQQLRFIVGIGQRDLLLQPVDQSRHAQRTYAGLLQLFCKLQVVGQAALAIEQAQQALGMLRTQIGDQREGTTALPALAPFQHMTLVDAQLLVDGVVRFVIESRDVVGITPQQHGGQGGAQAALVGRLRHGQQQQLQFGGLAGGEQALLAGSNGWNTRQRQGMLDTCRLAVAAHQHGDIAGLHGLAIDQCTACTRIG